MKKLLRSLVDLLVQRPVASSVAIVSTIALLLLLNAISSFFSNAYFVETLRANGAEVYFFNRQANAGDFSDSPEVELFGRAWIRDPIMVDLRNADLEVLKSLRWNSRRPRISSFLLDGSGVNDQMLESLCNVSELKHIDLSHTSVSGRGLSSILEFTDLEKLDIVGVALREDELLQLSKEPSLTTINLSVPPIASTAAAILQHKMPWCQVVIHVEHPANE
ncbi:MAG TPA: hypothetical protein PJ982_16635 [Lacipirellulaceae bacterium]|nr:hypothetical protein [Lacipirellulaceae bacterium]